ncbi:IclR family transcriptional regulator [Leucobacter sp. GX24907]
MTDPKDTLAGSTDGTSAEENSGDGSSSSVLNRSVLRAFSLLRAASNHPEGTTAAVLADEAGLARPTAFRLLLTLEEAGMLVKEQGLLSLGWEAFRLGRIADPRRGLRSRIQVVLDHLARELTEHVAYFAVTGPTSIDFISQAVGPQIMTLGREPDVMRFPHHATVAGKMLLSFLDDDELATLMPERLPALTPHTITDRAALLTELHEIRERGYGVIDDELEVGLFAVSVPVVDPNGDPLGMLVVSGRTERMKAAGVDHIVEALRPAAQSLAESLTS